MIYPETLYVWFGSQNARVIALLPGHTDRVNCVAWVPTDRSIASGAGTSSPQQGVGDETEILTGGSDGKLFLWTRKCDSHWQVASTIHAGGSPVYAARACWSPCGRGLFVACTGADHILRVFHRRRASESVPSASWEEVSRVELPASETVETLDWASLPFVAPTADCIRASDAHDSETLPLALVTGGVDMRVTLWLLQAPHPRSSVPEWRLERALHLRGHKNWVRCLRAAAGPLLPGPTTASIRPTTPRRLLIASASQDGRIRLWSIRVRPVQQGENRRDPWEGLLADAAGITGNHSEDGQQEGDDDDDDDDDEEEEEDDDDDGGNESDDGRDAPEAATGSSKSFARFSARLPTAGSSSPRYIWSLEARLFAVLTGHENWVASLRWVPPVSTGTSSSELWQPAALLSASLDQTVLVWQPEGLARADKPQAVGVWDPVCRLGQVGGTRSLGWVGALISPTTRSIVAHSHHGAWHAWENENEGEAATTMRTESFSETEALRNALWVSRPTPSGPSDAVSDVAWDASGQFFGAVSADKTCRLWAPSQGWRNNSAPWLELARPQCHGHPITALCFPPPQLPGASDAEGVGTSQLRLISGADEKVIRVFSAPRRFFQTMRVFGLHCPSSDIAAPVAEHAYIPELGLSNKAVVAMGETLPFGVGTASQGGLAESAVVTAETATDRLKQEQAFKDVERQKRALRLGEGGDSSGDAATKRRAKSGGATEGQGAPAEEPQGEGHAAVSEPEEDVLAGPPIEDELSQDTVWPETNKLFGHGNEILSIATTRSGDLIASSCKARDAETARIRLWDVATGRSRGSLRSHDSSVVHLAFCPRGQYLVSVSKDRHLTLFRRCFEDVSGSDDDRCPFELIARTKSHRRIVWDASWSPVQGVFATGSRDGTVKLWRYSEASDDAEQDAPASLKAVATLGSTKGPAVTSLAFAPRVLAGDRLLLAVGFESGRIALWHGDRESCTQWETSFEFPPYEAHAGSVKRLTWRPTAEQEEDDGDGRMTDPAMWLASGGDDGAVRVFRVHWRN